MKKLSVVMESKQKGINNSFASVKKIVGSGQQLLLWIKEFVFPGSEYLLILLI